MTILTPTNRDLLTLMSRGISHIERPQELWEDMDGGQQEIVLDTTSPCVLLRVDFSATQAADSFRLRPRDQTGSLMDWLRFPHSWVGEGLSAHFRFDRAHIPIPHETEGQWIGRTGHGWEVIQRDTEDGQFYAAWEPGFPFPQGFEARVQGAGAGGSNIAIAMWVAYFATEDE